MVASYASLNLQYIHNMYIWTKVSKLAVDTNSSHSLKFTELTQIDNRIVFLHQSTLNNSTKCNAHYENKLQIYLQVLRNLAYAVS